MPFRNTLHFQAAKPLTRIFDSTFAAGELS